jgi:hypothetical protein
VPSRPALRLLIPPRFEPATLKYASKLCPYPLPEDRTPSPPYFFLNDLLDKTLLVRLHPPDDRLVNVKDRSHAGRIAYPPLGDCDRHHTFRSSDAANSAHFYLGALFCIRASKKGSFRLEQRGLPSI